MNKLQIHFEHCYGISGLQHVFDFSNNNMPVAVYAPNGTMKTSLAKSLQDYSQKRVPSDLMFPERASKCEVYDEAGTEVAPGQIFVIESINEKYKSDRISTLLASDALKSEYDAIFASIALKLEALTRSLKKQSGLSKDVDIAFADAFKVNPSGLVPALARLDREVKKGAHAEFSKIKYKSIFSQKSIEFLQDADIQLLIGDYTKTYETLVDKSLYFKRGIFNHSNAEVIAKNLTANGWFDGGHSVKLKHSGADLEISTKADLVAAIQKEKDTILSDPDLRAKFDQVEKSISTAELRALREYLVENPNIVPELTDIDQFKQKVWISYLVEAQSDYLALVAEYDASEVRLGEIITEAEAEQTRWEAVVDLFNKRFSVPFEVRVENKSDAILNSKAPQLTFYFKDQVAGGERKTSREVLDKALSNGEKRALYILNIIFEVEARRTGEIETFFVFDDIADSFDYKNKYAIIEYLSDIQDTDHFHLIVLTHNFDFYRTIKGRLGVWGDNKVLCSRGQNSLSLIKDSLSENPFIYWKDHLDDPVTLIASIPFVRNLAEYTGNEASFNMLTGLLHIKSGSDAVTMSSLRDEYQKVLQPGTYTDFSATDEPVLNLIEAVVADILAKNPDELSLEDKIAISIGIRIKAERILIQMIAEPEWVAGITKNQTNKLIKRYRGKTDANADCLACMQKVQLMTPENIHLNSFMYEPILDLSGYHLQRLYIEVNGHCVAGTVP
tara:strand:- start:349 stop:2535 length:2187 start_codon:yes stop_codon:yes gene_type:complete